MTLVSAIDHHGWLGTERIETRFGDFEFAEGYPAGDTAKRLAELQVFNRAVEVYLEQMPAVSMYAIREGLRVFGARASHHVVVWESLMDEETILLTGNSETVYAMAFLDLMRDGPTVVDAPPGLLGGLVDMWQQQIADIGPTGADKGKGGRFLLLPPSYRGALRDGFITLRSRTNGVMVGVRGFLDNGTTDTAVKLLESMRIHSLSRIAHPPDMVFLNGSKHEIDTVFPDTYEFFEHLARLVELEPEDVVSPQERFFLASIGIQKGKPFHPDASRRKLLGEAARLGSAIARTNTFASTDPERLVYPDRMWEWAFIGGSASFDSQGFVNVDRRAAFAYAAIGMSPAMVEKQVGAGSQYLWTMHSSSGAFLDGGKNYRLHLPENIPVKLFWSVVVYDSESRSMLRNGGRFPTVSQYTGPAINPDGSVDIYFGPLAPRGKEKNWIETVEDKGWFPLLRFYGPLQPFFDKTWKPGDIEEVR